MPGEPADEHGEQHEPELDGVKHGADYRQAEPIRQEGSFGKAGGAKENEFEMDRRAVQYAPQNNVINHLRLGGLTNDKK